MTPTNSAVLTLGTPQLTASSSSGTSTSSRISSSYRGEHWNRLPIEFQSRAHQFLDKKGLMVVGKLNRTWRDGSLYTWDISTRNRRFSWRDAELHPKPRLNYLLTEALINIVFEIGKERDIDYRPIALELTRKYQHLMDAVPSFRCYAMKCLLPHSASGISGVVSKIKESWKNRGAKKIIYKKSEDVAATSDALLHVLMEVEDLPPLNSRKRNKLIQKVLDLVNSRKRKKLPKLLDLVLRAIDNNLTSASLLMTQRSHVWPREMLEKMAIASLRKGDSRALGVIVQEYSRDDLQRLQSENPELALPSVLYRLALKEEDPHKQAVALVAAFETYKPYEAFSGRPIAPEILYNVANAKIQLGCPEEANDLFDKFIRICGDKLPFDVLLRVAMFKFNSQKYEEANLLFMRIINEHSSHASEDVWSHVAYTKLKLGQYLKSIEYFECAIGKYRQKDKDGVPPLVLVHAAGAIVTFTQQKNETGLDFQADYRQADKYYTEAIEKYKSEDPSHALKVPCHVLIDAADLKIQLGDYREAIRLYNQAMQVSKELKIEFPADALANMAGAYLGLKNYEEADKLYSQFGKMVKGKISVKVLSRIAFVKLQLRDYKDAVIIYSRVIRTLKSEVSADILLNMALAYQGLKLYEIAIRFCARAIEKYGAEVPALALESMAYACLKFKDYEKAIHFYKLAIEKYKNKIPNRIQIRINYAQSKLNKIQERANKS